MLDNRLDAEALLAACGADEELLGRICQALQKRVPEELQRAEQLLAARDAAGLRESAHKLYGMIAAASSSVGDIASRLEDQAELGELEAASRSFRQLAEQSAELLAALDGVSLAQLQLLVD